MATLKENSNQITVRTVFFENFAISVLLLNASFIIEHVTEAVPRRCSVEKMFLKILPILEIGCF